MSVREINTKVQVDMIGAIGDQDLASVICPAGLIGLSQFDLRWFISQEQDNTAALALYEGYRLFPSFPNTKEALEKAREILEFLVQQNLLPDEITIVGREHHMVAPPGYQKEGDPTRHFKMMLRMREYQEKEKDENVRLLSVDDIPQIVELLSHDQLRTTPFKRGIKRIEAGLPYFGYYDGGQLIGLSGCYGLDKDLSLANLGDVFVHPEYRQKGVGKAVVEASLNYFKDQGIRTIGCDTGETDAPFMPSKLPVINHLLEGEGFKAMPDMILYQTMKKIKPPN